MLEELRADPGRASLETVLAEIAKLEQVRALLLPLDLFAALSPTVLKSYRQRMSAEEPYELRRHPLALRLHCWLPTVVCEAKKLPITLSTC